MIALEAGPFVFAHKGRTIELSGGNITQINRILCSRPLLTPSYAKLYLLYLEVGRNRDRNIVGRAAQITMMDGDIERSLLLLSCLKHNIRNFRNYLTLSHFRCMTKSLHTKSAMILQSCDFNICQDVKSFSEFMQEIYGIPGNFP